MSSESGRGTTPKPPADPAAAASYQLPSLSDGASLGRLAVIGVIVAGLAAAFAATGGWFSPQHLSPKRIIDAFQQANGVHPGFRRNHAKGVCVTGTFASNGQGERLSKAVVFQQGQVPVVGRLALSSGLPDFPDGPTVRSMALSFRLANGEEWRTGMNDIPVFPFKNAKVFYEQLVAATPDPATGKPDPAKMHLFIVHNPETAAAFRTIMSTPFPSGFANASYNGLDAFRFIDEAGTVTPVRWAMVASDPFVAEAPEQKVATNKNYLFDALLARLGQGSVQWHLVVTLGQPGDPTGDATIAWPAEREKIDVGTLTIDHAESEAAGNCRDINYDPMVLPSGIEPSDDPLLSARSAAYAQSFTRRSGEAKQPSAVQVPNSGQGADSSQASDSSKAP